MTYNSAAKSTTDLKILRESFETGLRYRKSVTYRI